MRLTPESELSLNEVSKFVLGMDNKDPSSTEEKTWRQIEDEQDPDGKNHDLKLTCTKCGKSQTCRCSKPKRTFYGICPSCVEKGEAIEKTADRYIDPFKIADEIMQKGTLHPHELMSQFGLSQSQAGSIYNLIPSAFGPGGEGHNWLAKQIGDILKGGFGERDASVFIFEDDPERMTIFNKAFGAGNISTTSNVSEALSMLRTGNFSRIYLDRDVSNPNENGEDLAWQMEKEQLCSQVPVVIHSENTRGQRVMARYIGRYNSNVSVIPFKHLKKQLDIPGVKI